VQFTRLRLTGFKSFVDATELWIEPGLTGVVGPNGCGKSNLVEAMRWVMGETSAKQMRGGAMDDVIFGGTDTRPARNLAEVSLTLDNSSRDAPPQYNDRDEVDVVRRIERGEGSGYRVNGSDVRARDVQTLFADAASGARSTALVSQGRIGALISAKPTDRRHLLEEAAGITGLHSRRHEAELRLRAAETNLERLDDVIGALEEQFRGLKKQARQATRYRSLSDHIRRAEAIYFHHQWKQATEQRDSAAERLKAVEETVAELTREVTVAITHETATTDRLPPLRDAEARAAAALQRLILARDGLEQEERRIQAECAEIEARIAQIDGDVERETALKVDAEAALSRLTAEIETIREAQQNEEGDALAARAALDESLATVQRLEQELTSLTESIAADDSRRGSLQRRIAEIGQRRARINNRLSELSRDREQAEAIIAAEGDSQELAEKLTAARETLDAARASVDGAETSRGLALVRESEIRESLREAETQRTRLRAEADALEALLTVGDPDLWPPMIDALSVEPGYELALAAALGDDLSAPIDEAAPVHWRSFPAFENPAPLPAGASPLAEAVNAPGALARRLSQIGVVADEEVGKRLSSQLSQGQRLVSRDGAVWRWDGFTALGEAGDSAANRLRQRNRLKDVSAEADRAEKILEDVRIRFETARQAAADGTDAERAARAAVRDADIIFQELRDREAAENRKLVNARSRLSSIDETLQELRTDDAESQAALLAAEQDLGSIADIEARREEAARQRAALSDVRSVANGKQNAHAQLLRESELRRNRLTTIDSERASWEKRRDNAEEQIRALDDRRGTADEVRERLQSRPTEIAEQRTVLFQQISEAESLRNQAADALAEAETALAAANNARRSAEAKLSETREERVRSEAAVTQIDQTMTAIVERAQEHIGCSPQNALESVEVADDEKLPDFDSIELRVEKLKRERDNMGPVNLRAEVEAAELDERIQTMITERDDLIAAIARLRQGISSLNREGRARLLAAFKEVDRHFQDLFIRLFGGGKAHLALTDADDPLEAGLEIMASPPGKKLQAMSLLSGGEQALTALALLFAVFQTNPAPICVLDEVDAPLDDANVERFCQMINEIAAQTGTRFLIVTHHRLTMAHMDRLFGVTMSERGVSQLVSVDLHAAEKLRDSA
jgi:chromosome segregation protein